MNSADSDHNQNFGHFLTRVGRIESLNWTNGKETFQNNFCLIVVQESVLEALRFRFKKFTVSSENIVYE